jgi:hypothetical protein
MKRFFCVILFILPLMMSCDKGSSSADYYVRYEYGLSSNPSFGSSYYNKTISVNTDSGIKDFTTISNSFTETFGPVKKGFKASITVEYESGGGTTNLRIYVSRGEEPFALKANGQGNSLSYTIDY